MEQRKHFIRLEFWNGQEMIRQVPTVARSGYWAVHWDGSGRWAIDHLPSGLLLGRVPKKYQALNFIKILEMECNVRSSKDVKRYIPEDIRNIIILYNQDLIEPAPMKAKVEVSREA